MEPTSSVPASHVDRSPPSNNNESSPVTSAKSIPQQMMEDTETVVFRDCQSGLGVKIIGGVEEEGEDGRHHGVFVKRILAGGRAAETGSLKEGDQLLSVNGKTLSGVTNRQAVQFLRSASATNQVTLVISRNASVSERYNALLNSKLSAMSGETPLSSDNDNTSSENISTGSTTPRNEGTTSGASSPGPSSPQEIVLSKSAGLGISIAGGTNRRGEGLITITDMIPGGDCHKDGRLSVGDTLLSINGESLQGVDHEVAKSILTKISLNRNIKSVIVRYLSSGSGGRMSKVDGSSGSYGYPTGTSHSSSVGNLTTPTSVDNRRELPIPPGNAHQGPYIKNMKQKSNDSDVDNQKRNLLDSLNVNDGVNLEFSPSDRASTLPSRITPQAVPAGISGTRTLPLSGSRSTQPADYKGGSYPRPPGDGGSLENGRDGQFQQQFPGKFSPQINVLHGQQTDRLQTPMIPTNFPASSLPPHMHRLAFPEPALHSTPQNVSGVPAPPMYHQLDFLKPTYHSTPQNLHEKGVPPLQQSYLSPVMSEQPHLHPPKFDLLTSSLSTASQTPSSQPRRLSIDPTLKLKVEKLQVALEYLGLQLDNEQKQNLRSHLHVDEDGMVQYGEFVTVAKQLFKMTLNETNLATLPMSGHDSVDFAKSSPISRQIPTVPVTITISVAELESLKRERDNALLECKKLRSIIQDRERSFNRAEEDLLRVRKDAQGAIHESRALKSRVHLAEAAQKEARNMELDYEEVVRLLESEVAELREQLKERPLPKKDQPESFESLRKRLAVSGGELRKSETSKKTFEVAMERLLQFAEFVHDYAVGGSNVSQQGMKGEAARRGRNGLYHPPGYLARHRQKGQVDLAAEAKDVVKAVKAMIEVEPLPYGWEETYTKDGSRFFTNHVTQTTSWIHPVSNINHSSAVGSKSLQDLPETVT